MGAILDLLFVAGVIWFVRYINSDSEEDEPGESPAHSQAEAVAQSDATAPDQDAGRPASPAPDNAFATPRDANSAPSSYENRVLLQTFAAFGTCILAGIVFSHMTLAGRHVLFASSGGLMHGMVIGGMLAMTPYATLAYTRGPRPSGATWLVPIVALSTTHVTTWVWTYWAPASSPP